MLLRKLHMFAQLFLIHVPTSYIHCIILPSLIICRVQKLISVPCLSRALTKILFYAIFFQYFFGGIAQLVEQTHQTS